MPLALPFLVIEFSSSNQISSISNNEPATTCFRSRKNDISIHSGYSLCPMLNLYPSSNLAAALIHKTEPKVISTYYCFRPAAEVSVGRTDGVQAGQEVFDA